MSIKVTRLFQELVPFRKINIYAVFGPKSSLLFSQTILKAPPRQPLLVISEKAQFYLAL